MARTLKLDNVDDALVARLSDRAASHGRSLEAEHRAILEQALQAGADFEDLAAKLRNLLGGRKHTPSEDLMREGREER